MEKVLCKVMCYLMQQQCVLQGFEDQTSKAGTRLGKAKYAKNVAFYMVFEKSRGDPMWPALYKLRIKTPT